MLSSHEPCYPSIIYLIFLSKSQLNIPGLQVFCCREGSSKLIKVVFKGQWEKDRKIVFVISSLPPQFVCQVVGTRAPPTNGITCTGESCMTGCHAWVVPRYCLLWTDVHNLLVGLKILGGFLLERGRIPIGGVFCFLSSWSSWLFCFILPSVTIIPNTF